MANAEKLVKLHGLWFRSLWKWAEKIPHEDAVIWLDENGSKAASLTYQKLRREALIIATCLRQVHCQPGDRAILCYPPSVSFVPAFLGCQICGLTAVPVYPPGSNDRDSDSIQRIVAMVKTTRPSVVLSSSPLRYFLKEVFPGAAARCVSDIRWIFTDELPDHVEAGSAFELDSLDIKSETPAFIQFSSGSTGNPKGCVVTHMALLHNIHLNWRMCGAFHPGTEESLYDLPVESYAEFTEKYQKHLVATWGHRLRSFSWLPVTHDMG
ncbi:AMP-binding enzyme domain-containing protein [Toxoplasma gondii RUB]|nr:AMP-binding enzyme domain-containing protein [Toxoplasma gondii RUB]PUA84892.1 hypothetical protein TGBR9_465007 [Toxoplasma gondii TgCATBr9]